MHLPEPRDPMAKFQAGLGPAQLLQALALSHLPGPPSFVPCPTRPGRGVRGRCPPGAYSPLADMIQAAGAKAARAEEKPGRVWGGKYPRHAHPRTGALRGEAARSAGTPPAGHLDAPAAAGNRRRPGEATLTASGPSGAGPGSPASPARPGPPTGSSRRRGHSTRSAAAPGGAFVRERRGACNKGLRLLLLRPGLLIKKPN